MPGTERGGDRDRDLAGRPRNARPRDELGRPLDRDAPGEPGLPDDLTLTPSDALALAQSLIDSGRPFHAHEVLEAVWKAAPAGERALWRGLAQLAVGLAHAMRGNARGAVALLRRGAGAVGASVARPDLIDAAEVSRTASGLADLIDRAGAGPIAAEDLELRLIRQPGVTGGQDRP